MKRYYVGPLTKISVLKDKTEIPVRNRCELGFFVLFFKNTSLRVFFTFHFRLLNAYDEHQTLLKEQDTLKRKAENGYVNP